MSDLASVVRARGEWDAASAASRSARERLDAAIVAAVSAGVSQSAIARELGMSRQAVQQVVAKRDTGPSDEDLERQIRDIERKWEGLVETYAGQFGSMESDRAAQAMLNRQSKAKKARRSTRLSVKGSRLAFAETRLLEEIRQHQDVPVFRVALGQLAVLDDLLKERERRQDARCSF